VRNREGEKMTYGYKHYDGRTIDLSALLDTMSKEEVARIAGQHQREHNLIASLEAFRNAGELDLACQVIHDPRYNGLLSKV